MLTTFQTQQNLLVSTNDNIALIKIVVFWDVAPKLCDVTSKYCGIITGRGCFNFPHVTLHMSPIFP